MKQLKLKHAGYVLLLAAIIAGAVLISENRSNEQILLSQTISPHKGTITVKK